MIIRWKERYTLAGQVGTQELGQLGSALPPLPRHILGAPFQESPGDDVYRPSLLVERVRRAGPWKLERREPGAFFEANAFDGFVFGRPKIDRVKIMYQPDSNVAVATLLAGEAHFSLVSFAR